MISGPGAVEGTYVHTDTVISMKTLIVKSLLTSLCQREEMHPSLEKRGTGRFFNNDSSPP
jgi:hypothetical protein